MKNLMALALLCAAVPVRAQLAETDKLKTMMSTENRDTVAWIYSGAVSLGGNQGFLHNSQAGGEIASLTINALANADLSRFYHNHLWSNTLLMSYGLWYAFSNKFVPRKTDDRIDFTSKYGFRLHPKENFYLTGIFNFRSQFTPGYDYSLKRFDSLQISRFFSPAVFTLAGGLEYRRGSDLSLFISPAAGKVTYASREFTGRLPEGAFGIENGRNSRYELGAYFSGRFQKEFNRHVAFRTRLDLYSNYMAKDKLDTAGAVLRRDSPANIDVLWDNQLTIKAGKYVSIILAATLIYDNDYPYSPFREDAAGNPIDKDEPGTRFGWWQIKQNLSVGFAYKF